MGEEKKKNKKGIFIGIAIAVIIIAIVVAGVIYISSVANSPEALVESVLNELKIGNYEQAGVGDFLEGENFDQETEKLLFDNLQWKISNVKIEDNKATVDVEITNKDFKTIINNYMQRVIKIAFAGEELTDEQITQYLVEELGNDQIQNVTVNKTIILENKDGKWEISEENDFVNILLPGFNEALNSLND